MLKTDHINFDVSHAWFARHSVFLQIINTVLSKQKYTGVIRTCDYIVNFVKVKM
jgi:hypothetical protein